MTRVKTKKEVKRLFLITAIMILLLTYFGFNVYNDYSKIKYNKNQVITLKNEYNKLVEDEKKLSSEAYKMKDPKYVARYAKEKYLFSSMDEIIIRMDK